jgi:hypothetical protein
MTPAQRWMTILWPAFLMAGVLEMLVFALIDPADLHWHGAALDWSRPAVYTAAFFVFWAVVSAATFLTAVLSGSDRDTHRANDTGAG